MRLNAQRRSMQSARDAVEAAERLVGSARAGVAAGINPEFMITMQQPQFERAREWADRTRYAFVRSWVRLAYLTGSDAFIRIDGEPGDNGREMASVTWLDEWRAQIGPAEARTVVVAQPTPNPHAFHDEVGTITPAPVEPGIVEPDLVEPAAGGDVVLPAAPTPLLIPIAHGR